MEANPDYEERRGRSRGRPRGRHRGRPRVHHRIVRSRRSKIESDDEEDVKITVESEVKPSQFDKDCDISTLEAPTFTTLDKGPPSPMLQLSWNHPVNLIGEKVLSPRIHSCDSCKKPILIYGRMIPCKHVFCLWCAKSEDRVCPKCGDRVARVEQTGLGTVFVCTFSVNDIQCKRTYLSQRDLQAHIDHRHVKTNSLKDESKDERISYRDPRGESHKDVRASVRGDPRPSVVANDPRVGGNKENYETRDASFSIPQFPRTFNPSQPPPSTAPSVSGTISHHIPVMTSSRTNLITVPIHDPSEQSYLPSTHIPPPSQHNQLSHPPPTHPFSSPPPIAPPYASPQYSYPPTGGPPPSFASPLPPVPVPPPATNFGNANRPNYEGHYVTNQWNAPPPSTSHLLPPRHHHPPPNSQGGNYYR